MSSAIPVWRSDRDYFTRSDPRRPPHLAAIRWRQLLAARIAASSASGDASYTVTIERTEIA